MKRVGLLFLPIAALAFASSALAYVSPGKPTGFVNDFANILSAEARSSLEAKLVALENETTAEVSVVTVPSLGDETIESYAVKLFEEWGIGKERQDTGLLILIAPTEREMRIEVGYGLEPVVTDAAAFGIIRNIMTPAFKDGDFAGGINGAVDAVSSLARGELGSSEFTESSNEGTDLSDIIGIAIIFAFQLLPVIIYSKSWWLGGVLGFILGFIIFASILPAFAIAAIGLFLDYVLSKNFAGKRPPGGKGGVWLGGIGNHHKGGGGFGGFGGFGGGSSGGGGASGRW